MSDQTDFERWSRLTDKQRACLDPLLERKTSKEIARIIGVSKPTVDQRLTTARSILGVDTRDQAAVEYARLKRTYDRITYDPMHIPDRAEIVPSDFAEGDPSTVIHLTDTAIAARSTDGTVEGLSNPLGLMLIDLFIQHCEEKKISTGDLCVSSPLPLSTALRLVQRMCDDGLIHKTADDTDGRRQFVELNPDLAWRLLAYFGTPTDD